jgi:hypothetical protein
MTTEWLEFIKHLEQYRQNYPLSHDSRILLDAVILCAGAAARVNDRYRPYDDERWRAQRIKELEAELDTYRHHVTDSYPETGMTLIQRLLRWARDPRIAGPMPQAAIAIYDAVVTLDPAEAKRHGIHHSNELADAGDPR